VDDERTAPIPPPERHIDATYPGEKAPPISADTSPEIPLMARLGAKVLLVVTGEVRQWPLAQSRKCVLCPGLSGEIRRGGSRLDSADMAGSRRDLPPLSREKPLNRLQPAHVVPTRIERRD
jgi:hypothetical protein